MRATAYNSQPSLNDPRADDDYDFDNRVDVEAQTLIYAAADGLDLETIGDYTSLADIVEAAAKVIKADAEANAATQGNGLGKAAMAAVIARNALVETVLSLVDEGAREAATTALQAQINRGEW